MARAIWKGSISFGLVNIPIELHTAVRDTRPHFRMLHAKDKSPVRFERVCIRDGHPVAWEDLVKGYEYSKGHFVVLSKEDFRAAAVEKTRTIDIIDFVQAEEIDDRFFETPYYLTPVKGGERAYALLREAIRESGRVGIAKFILRDTQHLAAVEVIEDAIVLSVMRFADELVDESQLTFPRRRDIRKPNSTWRKRWSTAWRPNGIRRSTPTSIAPTSCESSRARRRARRCTLEAPRRTATGRSRGPDGAAPPKPQSGKTTRPGGRSEGGHKTGDRPQGKKTPGRLTPFANR